MKKYLILVMFFFVLTKTGHGITKSWVQATANAEWDERSHHSSVVFDNKIWIIGGQGNVSSCGKDVWHSEDGITWTRTTANAEWDERHVHSSVVFDNKIWLMGGNGNSPLKNDVWYSEDGITWVQATANAEWNGRHGHSSVVFDNKIWVMGGQIDVSSYENDVWYSFDGITWTQATANAEWNERHGHSSVVFDNKIWVMGGYGMIAPLEWGFKNEVWWCGGFFPYLSWTGETGFTSDGFEIDTPATVTFRVKYNNPYNYANIMGCPVLHVMNGEKEIPGSPFTIAHISDNIYSYVDTLPFCYNTNYYFKCYDEYNSEHFLYGNSFSCPEEVKTSDFNYPNPFNPRKQSTNIVFRVNNDQTVKIKIYSEYGDLLYQTTTSATEGLNEFLYNGRDDNGKILYNGSYICRVEKAEGVSKCYILIIK